MTNTFLRCSTWFVALGLIHFLLPFYWQRKGEASAQNCSSSTTLCTSLLTILFLQRGCLELYRKFYSSKTNNSNNNNNDPDKNSIWKGRSAVYIRFALSLILVIWCLFAVLENSVQTLIFFFSSSSAGSTTIHPNNEEDHFHQTTDGKSQNNNNHNHEEDEAAILRKIYNPHHSMVDADRSSYDTLAKSRKNLENHKNAFSPGGSVPHYHRLLQDDGDDHHHHNERQQQQQQNDKNIYDDEIVVQEDVAMQELLCPLQTSLLSSVFLSWLIHNGAIMYIFFSNIQSTRKHNKLVMNHRKNLAEARGDPAKGDSKNDAETTTTSSVPISSTEEEEMMLNVGRPEVTTCWALSSDPLVELQMSTSIAIVTFLINWSCQSWSSNSFLPFHSLHLDEHNHFEDMSHRATLSLNVKVNEILNSYHTFATGLCILYFEFYFHCLPMLKTLTLSLTRREVEFVDSLNKKMVEELENKKKDGKENGIVNEKIIKKVINAKKTHEGKLKICFIHADESGETIMEVEKLLKEVMAKNPYFNRIFEI